MPERSVESRIARDIVNRYGRLPDDPNQRHGSRDVALTCRCELCSRAYPDKKKRQRVKEKSRKTNACRQGTKGHQRCGGWGFAAGARPESKRGAKACECPCHTDGRGRAIPTLDEYLAEVEAKDAAWRAGVSQTGEGDDIEG